MCWIWVFYFFFLSLIFKWRILCTWVLMIVDSWFYQFLHRNSKYQNKFHTINNSIFNDYYCTRILFQCFILVFLCLFIHHSVHMLNFNHRKLCFWLKIYQHKIKIIWIQSIFYVGSKQILMAERLSKIFSWIEQKKTLFPQTYFDIKIQNERKGKTEII